MASASALDDWGRPGEGHGVAIVAPYPSVRAGLRAIVEQVSGAVVLDDGAGDDLDPPRDPDTIIIDVETERADIVERVARQFPDASLLLLLDDPAPYHQMAARDGAVVGALPRSADGEDIAAALAALERGLLVIDPALARMAPAPAGASGGDEGPDSLTPRERQVLELLAQGLPNKAIALELGVSEHTAKFHVGTIMSKLGAASRTEAVAIAARRGLLVL